MPYDEHDHRQQAVDKARESLEGLFDGLVIVGTWQTEDGGFTAVTTATSGNWHAQSGVMQYLLKKRLAGAELEAEDQHRENDTK